MSNFFVLVAGLLGSSLKLYKIPARQSGTFTKKIKRQLLRWISKPPTIGPAAIAALPAAVHKPIARARVAWSCAKERLSMANELGIIVAAPIPCITLKIISISAVFAKPQPVEAIIKITIPS